MPSRADRPIPQMQRNTQQMPAPQPQAQQQRPQEQASPAPQYASQTSERNTDSDDDFISRLPMSRNDRLAALDDSFVLQLPDEFRRKRIDDEEEDTSFLRNL